MIILYSSEIFSTLKIVDRSPGIVIPEPDLRGLTKLESFDAEPGKFNLLNSANTVIVIKSSFKSGYPISKDNAVVLAELSLRLKGVAFNEICSVGSCASGMLSPSASISINESETELP